MDYKEFVTKYNDSCVACFIFDPKQDPIEITFQEVWIKENQIVSWGHFVGDDPTAIEESQEDFASDKFIVLDESNPIYKEINRIKEEWVDSQ